MVEKIGNPTPPTGLRRFFFRLPITLYKWHLGGLLGGRFVLLNHIGRLSGKPRQVVLEVVDHERPSPTSAETIYVASGFGAASDWLRNLRHTPDVTIQVGRKQWPVSAEILDPAASGQKMVQYAHQHPKAAKELMRLIGYKVDGSDDDWNAIGRDHIPFVRFKPRVSAD